MTIVHFELNVGRCTCEQGNFSYQNSGSRDNTDETDGEAGMCLKVETMIKSYLYSQRDVYHKSNAKADAW